MIKKMILCSLALSFFSSCVAVKEYEKVTINDPDMALSEKTYIVLKQHFNPIVKQPQEPMVAKPVVVADAIK